MAHTGSELYRDVRCAGVDLGRLDVADRGEIMDRELRLVTFDLFFFGIIPSTMMVMAPQPMPLVQLKTIHGPVDRT